MSAPLGAQMKIQIASDLHLEFLERNFPDFRVVEPSDADVMVLAGDIHNRDRAFDVFRDWPCPVLLLHGNHELYGSVAEEVLDQLGTRGNVGSVRYLEQEAVVIGGVRFLGCCLWTDYALDGDQGRSMFLAKTALMDHKAIRTRHGTFSPQDALKLHHQARDWLKQSLAQPHDGPTVICTHHAPHVGSIHSQYAGNPHNPAFVSDLSELLGMADLWLHGHVHNSFDYQVGRTRVVANPRGYALNLRKASSLTELVWENPSFDARKVIEL